MSSIAHLLLCCAAVCAGCSGGTADGTTALDGGSIGPDANLFGLHPEGPPMIRQVFAREPVMVNGMLRNQHGLAFGTHPAFDEDDGQVTGAFLGAQRIRVVLDERIPTNMLYEYACQDGEYGRVPPGTTDQELAACSASLGNLGDCGAGVCLDSGGFVDLNKDGRPDSHRMINYGGDPENPEYAIALYCDDVSVPLDERYSGYFAYGSQVYDPFRGIESLGPAIVFDPLYEFGLRMNATCRPWFRSGLTDDAGNAICAPAGGVVSAGCSDGNLDGVDFDTEAFRLFLTIPNDGAINIPLTSNSIYIESNAALDPATFAAITLSAGGTPVAINPVSEDSVSLRISLDQPF